MLKTKSPKLYMPVNLEVEPLGLANEGAAFVDELSHSRTSAISREQLSSLSECLLSSRPVMSTVVLSCKKALTRKHKHSVFVDSPARRFMS